MHTDAPGGHVPVLLREVVEVLRPRADGIYIDGTFGGGGYTRAILAAAPCRVWAIDRDPAAVARGQAMAASMGGRLTMIPGNFEAMDGLLAARGIAAVDGVALDLGVSSQQIDDPARGFSFRADGPLDMRMGGEGPTAADVVNQAPEAELARIVFDYGEERRARAVARAIVRARAEAPIATTAALASVVRRVVRPAADGIDPATRTFQALRIHVNDELGSLARGLDAAERLLATGGRLAVVAFHSLEDRAVKRFLAERGGRASQPSRHAPAAATPDPTFAVLTRKPVTPAPDEVARNPRSRSARLRAAERTQAAPWRAAA